MVFFILSHPAGRCKGCAYFAVHATIITVSCFLSTEKRLHAKNRLLQAFNHWQEPVYFLQLRHPQTMQVAEPPAFRCQLKYHHVAELSAIFRLHKEPLDVVPSTMGVLHCTHRNREGLCSDNIS